MRPRAPILEVVEPVLDRSSQSASPSCKRASGSIGHQAGVCATPRTFLPLALPADSSGLVAPYSPRPRLFSSPWSSAPKLKCDAPEERPATGGVVACHALLLSAAGALVRPTWRDRSASIVSWSVSSKLMSEACLTGSVLLNAFMVSMLFNILAHRRGRSTIHSVCPIRPK